MIQRLYLISGMGADEKIFRNLDFGSTRLHFIAWKKVQKSESFDSYVQRLCEEINTQETFAICGVSLGGIVAQEMTRYLNPEFLILISTIKGREELPAIIRMAAGAKLQKVIPEQFYKWAAMHSASAVGMKSKSEHSLFLRMIDQFGEYYYKWCINTVAEWSGVDLNIPYLHLHGDRDLVFPSSNIKNAVIIKHGTHFMVMNKAGEVSKHIRGYLEKEVIP